MTSTDKLPGISVRPAELRDFEQITEIYRMEVLTGTGSFEIEPPELEEIVERFTAVKARKGFWFVALSVRMLNELASQDMPMPRPFIIERPIAMFLRVRFMSSKTFKDRGLADCSCIAL